MGEVGLLLFGFGISECHALNGGSPAGGGGGGTACLSLTEMDLIFGGGGRFIRADIVVAARGGMITAFVRDRVRVAGGSSSCISKLHS